MLICGLDEVGRGSLAGPLVAAATVFGIRPARRCFQHQLNAGGCSVFGLQDSKKLAATQRNKVYKQIIQSGAVIAIEEISVRIINVKGIGWANREIFRRLKKRIPADVHIADGNLKIAGIKSIVKADTKIPEVMAASIIAKVWRDRLMTHLHNEFPHYGWQTNKGYGTVLHLLALRKHGPCRHHRKLFIRNVLKLGHGKRNFS